MKYKALVCDVDGTFVVNRHDALPTERVLSAVAKAQKVIKVCLATGRPLFEVKNILVASQITDLSIICGGAQIVDPKTDELLWEKTLERADCESVRAVAAKLGMEKHLKLGLSDQDYPSYRDIENILQLFMQGLELKEAEEFVTAVSHIPDIAVHMVPSWTKNRVDVLISHAEATKQHGIFELSKLLGIETHEMIGVGDAGNDFPLLMACGLKVAMGNASEDLKAIADYIAPTVEEDGVADVIEKFILNDLK